MFGFENEAKNHYQQFVINYCHERLHQAFLQIVIKDQEELYLREGLEWAPISYFDNEIICDLLDKSNHGILNLLDEPQTKNDENYLLRVRQCSAGHPNYLGEENSAYRQTFQ